MNDITSISNQNSLVPVIENPYADSFFETLSTGATFLPRLQLFIATSDAVKDEKIGMNCWGLVQNNEIDSLGKEVDLLVITRRPKAIDMSDKNNIRVSYNIESELFAEIKNKADTIRTNSGCQYGMEFLIWVPSRAAFAVFLMGNPTSRNEARNVSQYLGQPMTLKSRIIDNGKFKWQGPLACACSTPFNIPPADMIKKVAEVFLAPKEQAGLEKVQEEEDRTR